MKSTDGAQVEVFKAGAVPTLIYGCESWVLKERVKSRKQAAEMRVLRKIAGVSRLDHVRNETVRKRLRLEQVQNAGMKRWRAIG